MGRCCRCSPARTCCPRTCCTRPRTCTGCTDSCPGTPEQSVVGVTYLLLMSCHLLEADVGDVLLGGVLAVVGLGVVLVHLPVPLLVLLLQRCDTSRRLVGSSTCCWPRWSPKMRWYICSLDCALSELWRPGPSARPPNLSSPSPVSSYRARRVGSLEIRAVNEPSQNSPSSLFKVPTSAILQLRIL